MRIIAADIPRHRDHLAMALVISVLVSVAVAVAIVLLPRPSADENPRYLEHARFLRAQAVVEREHRLTLDPVFVSPTPPEELEQQRAALAEIERGGKSKTPPFVTRYPARETVRVWFAERITPMLQECMNEHPPSSTMQGALTLSFDEVGLVDRADLTGVNDVFANCARKRLLRSAFPDAFELTFTWPFVLEPNP